MTLLSGPARFSKRTRLQKMRPSGFRHISRWSDGVVDPLSFGNSALYRFITKQFKAAIFGGLTVLNNGKIDARLV